MQSPSTPFIIFSLMAVIYFVFWWQRNRAFQTLIDRYHLARLEADLPAGFPLNDALDDKDGSNIVKHAISGQYGEDILLTFDLGPGFGGKSIPRTIVARRFATPPPPCALPSHIRLIESGPWRIARARRSLFYPSATLHPKAIEHLWNLLAGPDASPLQPRTESNPIPTETTFIRPRKR